LTLFRVYTTVKTIRVYSSENRTSDLRSSWWKRKETQFDLILGHGRTGRLNTCPSMKSKRVHSVSLFISEFNAFACIITRAARSAHPSTSLSAMDGFWPSLVFFNSPHSDTIPLSPSVPQSLSLSLSFIFNFYKDTFHFQWDASACWQRRSCFLNNKSWAQTKFTKTWMGSDWPVVEIVSVLKHENSVSSSLQACRSIYLKHLVYKRQIIFHFHLLFVNLFSLIRYRSFHSFYWTIWFSNLSLMS
jgi:hypothetical protein